jgi:hypothetical protein
MSIQFLSRLETFKSFRKISLLLVFVAFSHDVFAAEPQPTSEGAAVLPKATVEKTTGFVLRVGNESNPVDGIAGPLTYGFRGHHEFENGFGLEAGYIRLHEPGSSTFTSVVDEAQVTAHLPQQGAWTYDLTLWRNRMIDMYTNLVGVEISRKADVTPTLGLYAGSAEQADVFDRFRGAQIGFSASIAGVDSSIACLFGQVGPNGNYRKCGIEGAKDFREESALPLTLSLAVEERVFDFGTGGPVSEPRDEFIFVSALEIHLENLFH